MKITKSIGIILFLLACFESSGYTQNIKKEIQSLEEDYRKFNFQRVIDKGKFLLKDPFLTKGDSLKVYQFMLNASYTLNDTVQARKLINEILNCSSDFVPDPKITSPKIVEFFNLIKKQKITLPNSAGKLKKNQSESLTSIPSPPVKYLFSTLFLPGSGHLWQGEKKRGYLFSTISAVFWGGIYYYSHKTSENRKKYMQAAGNDDYDDLYDRYNSSYKIRNTLIAGYVLYNCYVLYDFYTSRNHEQKLSLQYSPQNDGIRLSYSKCW